MGIDNLSLNKKLELCNIYLEKMDVNMNGEVEEVEFDNEGNKLLAETITEARLDFHFSSYEEYQQTNLEVRSPEVRSSPALGAFGPTREKLNQPIAIEVLNYTDLETKINKVIEKYNLKTATPDQMLSDIKKFTTLEQLRACMSVAMKQEDNDGGLNFAIAASLFEPENAFYKLKIGYFYSKLRMSNEALEFFLQAANLEPNNADYQFQVGNTLMIITEGNYTQAKAYLDKAVQLNPQKYTSLVAETIKTWAD